MFPVCFVRDVVARDLDLVDDRGLPLVDGPAQVHHRLAVGAGAADHLRLHVHVDVAVVVVQRAQLLGGVVPPRLVEERRTVLGAAQPEEPAPALPLEREQLLELVRREAAVPHDLERADAVGVPFAHAHDQRGLPGGVVHDQGVAQHLEVHEPLVAVELREPCLEVLAQLLVVVLPGAEPPEPFGAGLHPAHQITDRDVRIPLEPYPCHCDPPALVHVEDDAYAGRVGLVHWDDLDLGEIVALSPVQRVDAPARAGHGGRIERPTLRELRLVPHAALGHSIHPAHRPLEEDGALAHLHDQELPTGGGVLRDPHVVVLPARVQRLDRALHVPVAERPSGCQAALVEQLLALDAAQTQHHNRIGRDGGGVGRGLALRAHGARGEHSGTQDDGGEKLADHAFEPESARNANRSLSGATSTSISSPRANSPTRIFSESGSSTYF